MAARKVLIGVAVLALGGGVLASVANATPLCGSKACRDEAAASGLAANARSACRKSLISDCQAGLCSCTGGSPPCSCVCGDGLCGPSEDCGTCPQDCGTCPTTTTTTTTSTPTTTTTGLPPCVGFAILDPDNTITTIPRGEPLDVPVRATSSTGGFFDVFLLDNGAGGHVLCPPTGCVMGVILALGQTTTVHFTYTAAATAPSTITLTVNLNPHSIGFTCGSGSSGSTFSKTYPVSP